MGVSIFPLLNGISLSFQDYYILKPNKPSGFNGIQNYIKLFQDSEFHGVLLYTLIYTVSVVVLSYCFGWMIALLLNKKIRFRGLYRALVLLPWMVSSTVAGTNWMWVLNDRIGFLNQWLQKLNIVSSPILFLAVPELARMTVIFTGAWKAFPFTAIALLAAIQGISKDLYESAQIDGAGYWRSFFHITFPMVRNVSAVSTILMFIWNFNSFEAIYLLTRGGPANATFTLPILTYNTAFYRSNMGYASAIGTMILLVLLIVSLIYLRLLRANEHQ